MYLDGGHELHPSCVVLQDGLLLSFSSQGKELHGPNVSGNLCIRHPWPGMARSIYGDHDRFMDTYYRPYPGEWWMSMTLPIYIDLVLHAEK